MTKLALAVESMKNHTTDEGWQIFDGLSQNGYLLCGHNLPEPETDVSKLLEKYKPEIVVIQDRREWDIKKPNFRDPNACFTNWQCLKGYDGFKVTILKDAHQDRLLHRDTAEEMGIDAHIIYYDENVVRLHASWLGAVIRTWHTIDKNLILEYKDRDKKAILSGAISNAYPLRRRIAESRFDIPEIDYLSHPGYHRKYCCTPSYLAILSQYRISICTSSVYHYALRKIMESTACGCRVITNLPAKYSPPGIETNLFRIPNDISIPRLRDVIMTLDRYYESDRQKELSEKCKELYDFRVVTNNLALDIESLAERKKNGSRHTDTLSAGLTRG